MFRVCFNLEVVDNDLQKFTRKDSSVNDDLQKSTVRNNIDQESLKVDIVTAGILR
jgi:hypothetical protein